MITLERLHTALGSRPFQYFPQVESTNDIALNWLRDGAAVGSIVVSDEQTRGRGRLGRSWYAPPGTALMFSMVLYPPETAVGRVTMMGALCICEALESLGASDIGIKWPNDVRLNGRKVSGVLSEAVWQDNHLRGVVLGMGINMRIDFTGTDFESTAISIEPALGKTVERIALLVTLLNRLDHWYSRIESDALFAAWKQRLVVLGREVTAGEVRGVAEDVDSHGTLLVRTEEGILRRVVAGDIALGE